MKKLTIDDVKIHFPFQPYQVQQRLMEKVIRSLNKSFDLQDSNKCKFNALLDSPTGTGKTLSLICSSLAWLYDYKVTNDALETFPKIIYTTRTQSQISNVIKELKTTVYEPRTCVLASRKFLCSKYCTNHEMSSSDISRQCYNDRISGNCEYESDPDKLKGIKVGRVKDIEDLMADSKRRKYCQYYYQREVNKQKADLLVVPYNYIFDPHIRRTINLDLQESAIIVDEAHNVGKICSDSCSVKFCTSLFANMFKEIETCTKIGSRNLISVGRKIKRQALTFIKAIENEMKKNRNISNNNNNNNGRKREGKKDIKVLDGNFLHQLLYECFTYNEENTKLHVGTYEDFLNYYRNYFGKFLKQFLQIIKKLYSLGMEEEELSKHFKVVIKQSEESVDFLKHTEFIKEKTNHNKQNLYEEGETNRTQVEQAEEGIYFFDIHFICLTPSVSINLLVEEGVKDLILSSGTLSPLQMYPIELGIPFPISLENTHVIKRKQLLPIVCSRGPTNINFDSTFKNRTRKEYKMELGGLIVSVCKNAPDGVLVFFPSTKFMNDCMNCWKEKHSFRDKPYYEQISNQKRIFKESKDSKNSQSIISNFEKAIFEKGSKGAVFFAVCRGRASEGMDFSGKKCRCVVVIGMPFPPKDDYSIVLKKDYLDKIEEEIKKKEEEKRLKNESFGMISNNNQNDRKLPLSKIWYSQQSAMAVNQAIGRVIRNRNDFGAMVLADYRFSLRQNKNNLSRWIQPNLEIAQNFRICEKKLKYFFNVNARLNVIKSPISSSNSKREEVSQVEKIRFDDDEDEENEDFSQDKSTQEFDDIDQNLDNEIQEVLSPKKKQPPAKEIFPSLEIESMQSRSGSLNDQINAFHPPLEINPQESLNNEKWDNGEVFVDEYVPQNFNPPQREKVNKSPILFQNNFKIPERKSNNSPFQNLNIRNNSGFQIGSQGEKKMSILDGIKKGNQSNDNRNSIRPNGEFSNTLNSEDYLYKLCMINYSPESTLNEDNTLNYGQETMREREHKKEELIFPNENDNRKRKERNYLNRDTIKKFKK